MSIGDVIKHFEDAYMCKVDDKNIFSATEFQGDYSIFNF